MGELGGFVVLRELRILVKMVFVGTKGDRGMCGWNVRAGEGGDGGGVNWIYLIRLVRDFEYRCLVTTDFAPLRLRRISTPQTTPNPQHQRTLNPLGLKRSKPYNSKPTPLSHSKYSSATKTLKSLQCPPKTTPTPPSSTPPNHNPPTSSSPRLSKPYSPPQPPPSPYPPTAYSS